MTDAPDIRALLHAAVPPSDGVDLDELAVRMRPRPRRRPGRPPGWAIGAAAVATAAAVVVVVAAGHRDERRAAPPAVTPYSPTDYAGLVPHDGDRVRAGGHVVAIGGVFPRICPNYLVALPGSAAAQPIEQCRYGVELRGLDVDALGERRQVGGAVEGLVTVEGVYRDGAITVDKQISHEVHADRPNDVVPCEPPAAGWPKRTHNFAPAQRYADSHPGTVVQLGLMHPAPGRDVVVVATSGDPRAVRAALRPVFGDSLCVARSPFSPQQLRAAERTFDRLPPSAAVTIVAQSSADATGLPALDVQLFRVTPALAALAQRQPPGLVQLNPTLYPLR